MALPPQFLDDLRARLPLSEVVGKRLRLIRAGREFKAPCPFHNEKTPSFYVNDQKGFFHCFGCGAHGDLIGFVMRHDNLSFPEAVELLAAEAGLPVPRASPEERRRFERQKSLYDLMERAAHWFEQQLHEPGGRAARDYLLGRGLSAEAVARFRLGFAPADGGLLRAHLAHAGYADADMIEAGLLRRPEDGRAPYSFFRDRVMFPVTDRRGRVVAFGGRILHGEGPKYINSTDTPLFQKGRLLYNLARARQAAADGQPVVVVEGYMDVITLVEAGFAGAVAPLGTALTEAQILELWKLIPALPRVPVLCFDGDAAGRRAAHRAVARLLPHLRPDHSVRVAFLPQGEDPDSLVRRRGRGAMEDVLAQAWPLADVLWEMAAVERRLDTPEARAGFKAALDDWVNQIADRTVQAFYRQEMRQRVDEAFGWRARLRFRPDGRGGRPGAPGPGRPEPFTVRPPGFVRLRPRGAEIREKVLLATVINHPELFEEVGEALALAAFSSAPLDSLRQAVVEALSRNSGLDAAALAGHLSEHGFSRMLAELLSAATYVHAPFARPEAGLEEARAGWRGAWRSSQRRHLRAELQEAGKALGRESNEENLNRLLCLQVEVQSGLDDFDDPEFQG